MKRGVARNALLLLISSAIALLVGEVAVRILTPFPITRTSNQRDHAELLYVNDGLPDLDAWGFRNADTPSGETVFAIGDSHTYGFNVAREEAWPAVLEEMSGADVYNFGVGGYNVYHYARLFELAVEQGAAHVVVALYPANDFGVSACRILELSYWQGRAAEAGLETSACEDVWRAEAERGDSTQDAAGASGLKARVRENIALVAAFDELIWDPMRRARLGVEADGFREADFLRVADLPGSRIHQNLLAELRRDMDLAEPVVDLHWNNALRLLDDMASSAAAAGVRLSVLLVPSKARIVMAWGQAGGAAIPDPLAEVATIERALTDSLTAVLDGLQIPNADIAPGLERLFAADAEAGVETYPALDGHPWAAGYRVYAETARQLLEQDAPAASRPPESPVP